MNKYRLILSLSFLSLIVWNCKPYNFSDYGGNSGPSPSLKISSQTTMYVNGNFYELNEDPSRQVYYCGLQKVTNGILQTNCNCSYSQTDTALYFTLADYFLQVKNGTIVDSTHSVNFCFRIKNFHGVGTYQLTNTNGACANVQVEPLNLGTPSLDTTQTNQVTITNLDPLNSTYNTISGTFNFKVWYNNYTTSYTITNGIINKAVINK